MSAANDAETFVRRIDNLRAILEAPSDGALVDGSRDLRQLLLDGEPLLIRMAKLVEAPLRYRVSRYMAERAEEHLTKPSVVPGRTMWSMGDTLAGFDHVNLVEVTHDKFLSIPLLVLDDRTLVRVQDVVKYAANVAGGVHAGKPKTELHQAMAALREPVIFGNQSLFRPLKSINKVVVGAGLPIYWRLRA